uniref:Uncharacterized protein n=2 Tax=Timema TaxID=61471 RepID=A0A7R9AY32_TIMSH|nr:unnamed protein product [Timema shepardi]CAD7576335.1 unnamed protein product [Timema californicum]
MGVGRILFSEGSEMRVLLLSVICTMVMACVMAGDMCGLKRCCKDEVCVDTSDPCAKTWCPSYQCKPVVPEKYCNCLCKRGQVCIDTGIRCITTPCPTFQCAWPVYY